MIIITGAAGFIGSVTAARLNEAGYQDLVLVDDFSREDKKPNWTQLTYTEKVDRKTFFDWVKGKEMRVQAIVHLGARTDTTEKDVEIFDVLNVSYTQKMWDICAAFQIPLIYASSAATYGDGSQGFQDIESEMPQLAPLNPYGQSKQDVDTWVLSQEKKPFFWAGLKFFNVYGPNENHKGRMASVVWHAFQQIQATGAMKLFRSHRDTYKDGWQLRDFIFVEDVANVILWLLENRPSSGIFNLGTGKARSFWDLTQAVFSALDMTPDISFIDIPEDIREGYQYFTEAHMEKLRAMGYDQAFTTLEDGVHAYVKDYLLLNKYR